MSTAAATATRTAATSITARATQALPARDVRQQPAVGRQPGEGPHHEDLAVGEVDQLDDPVDHRVAQRDEAVGGPQHGAVDDLLEELPHGSGGPQAPCGLRADATLGPDPARPANSPVFIGFQALSATWYTVSSLVTVSPYWSKATLPVAPSKLVAWMASMIAGAGRPCRPASLPGSTLARALMIALAAS